MPDGFDPHKELARIYTLSEMMKACRERTPKILEQIDQALEDPTLQYSDRIKIWEMLMNRGYGKPRQHVYVNEAPAGQEKRVQVYIPDNSRTNVPTTNGRTFDAEAA